MVIPEPPLDPNARSLIIVLRGESTLVYGIDLESRSGALLELESTGWTSDRFTATAFGFDRPLSFYGLAAGFLGAVDGPRSCGLSKPITAADYDSDQQSWREVEPVDHEAIPQLVDVAGHGCTSVELCRAFYSDVVELPSTNNVHVLLKLDEETALVAVRGGRFFEVTRSSLTERIDLAGLPAEGGIVLPSGEIWLSGSGKLARGTRSGPFEEMEVPDSAGETLPAIAVRDGEVLVLGVAELQDIETATIALHRFASGAWTIVERRVEPSAASRLSDILHVGDQTVISFGGINGWVWDGARITSFVLPSPVPLFEPRLNDSAFRADYGPVLGANDGFLYRLEGDATEWTPIADAILGNGIRGVGVAYDGFLFGGPDGVMNQFYPGSIACNAERLARADVEQIEQLGDAVLVAGGNPQASRPNTLTWLYE